jgi:cob(I)alamin adenosyltransferase
MSNRKLFTAKGDDGMSSLQGPGRFSKADKLFEILGTLDECSAMVGLTKSIIEDPEIKSILTQVQRHLYQIMGEVSIISEQKQSNETFSSESITWLESVIEELADEVNSPDGFIIPGDTTEDALLDLTRTIIRRTERRIAVLFDDGRIENSVIRQYINRLSSLIYTLELIIHHRMGVEPPTMAKVK